MHEGDDRISASGGDCWYQDRAWNARVGLHVAVPPAVLVGLLGSGVLYLLNRPDEGNDPAAMAVALLALGVFVAVWMLALRSSALISPTGIVVLNPYRVVLVPAHAKVSDRKRQFTPATKCVRLTYIDDVGVAKRVTVVAVPSGRQLEFQRMVSEISDGPQSGM